MLGITTGDSIGERSVDMSLTGEQNLSPCSPKEPDTRVMYHCTLQDKPTLVIVLDTDILTLSLIS